MANAEYTALLEFEADTSDLSRAEKGLQNISKAGVQTQAAGNKVTQMFRAQKGAAQQVAFQLQDLQVQLQGGTAASRALSQQLPQLLGVFGAGGAAIGLFAGIAAAAFAPLIDDLFETESATDRLATTLDSLKGVMQETKRGTIGLSEELLKLAKVSDLAAKASIYEAVLETEDAMSSLKSEIVDAAQDLGVYSVAQADLIRGFRDGTVSAQQLSDAYDRFFPQTSRNNKAFRENRKILSELTMGYTTLENKLGDLKQIQTDLSKGLVVDPKQADEEAEAIGKLNDSLAALQNKRLEKAQQDLYKLEDSFRSERNILEDNYNEQLALINAGEQLQLDTARSFDELRLENKRQYTEKLTELEEKERAEAEKTARIQQQLDQQVLQAKFGFIGQIGDLLQQGVDQNSAAAKAGYALSQGIQFAQAINSAELAAAGQLAAVAGIPDPQGVLYAAALVRANTARALGYASAGIIAGQTIGNLAGRAQGGQVRPGQAYRVGEYGPETLVMGSNGGFVSPANTNMGGAPIQVVNNVKVVGGTPDAKVTTNTQQVGDRKVVQSIVIDLMRDPNSPARAALHSTSNVRPRGTL